MKQNVKKKRYKGRRKENKQHSTIVEPRVNCHLCNKVIDSIAQAISESDGSFSHFDCVLNKIKEENPTTEKQKVTYIGRGIFAVVELDSENKYSIVKEIPYESPETFQNMKKFVEGQKDVK